MPTEPKTKKEYVTIEEYLQLEEYAQVKHEYVGGSVVEMPGAKYSHNLICANTIRVLGNILDIDHQDCRMLTSDMKILIPSYNSIVYPDASILCGDPIFFEDRTALLTNPKLIFEVLSESTQAYDRGEKFEKYSSLDSLEEYVLIGQDEPLVEVFSLMEKEEGLWKISRYRDLNGKVKLHSLGIQFPVEEVYKNIKFT